MLNRSRTPHLTTSIAIILCLLLSACSSLGIGQSKTYTIGFVTNIPNLDPAFQGFKDKFKELGYIEGTNVTYLYDGVTPIDKLEPVFQSLKEKKVDLVFTLGTVPTLTAKKVFSGTDIPTVFALVTYPAKSGVVDSLLKPGGNLTGLQNGYGNPKRLEWLIKMAPKIKRIFVPHNPKDSASVVSLEDLQQAANTLGVTLDVHEVHTPEELKALTVSSAIPPETDAIYLMTASTVLLYNNDFIKVALERHLPLTGPTLADTKAGALMSYGTKNDGLGKQVARLADQILKGMKPAELPVEQSELFLEINLKTANAIGITVPDDILQRADSVIRP